MAYEFPQHLFGLVLQYLLPPQPPLPFHLLSPALLQRHHFLSIDSTSDPGSYFLWPKNDGSSPSDIISALEQASAPDADHGTTEIMYDYDVESILARVRLGSQLQVIFVLSPLPGSSTSTSLEPEWRYHDVAFLPFPTHSQSSFQNAMAAREALVQNDPEVSDDAGNVPLGETFWEGYDSSVPPSPSNFFNPADSRDPSIAEESYWSSYASHDSRSPSPPAINLAVPRTDTRHIPPFPSEVQIPSTIGSVASFAPSLSSPGPGLESGAPENERMAWEGVIRAQYRLWSSLSGLSRQEGKQKFREMVDHVLQAE